MITNPPSPTDKGNTQICEHKNFDAEVQVNRLEDSGTFVADVHINCVDCGRPFQFEGLPYGVMPEKPSVSIDKREARLPIMPGDKKYDVPGSQLRN